MPSKPKTAKRERSRETVAVVIALREQGKSYAQIADHVNLPRTTVAHIINRAERTPDDLYRPIKRAWRPATLDARGQRALIRHVERNPNDNLVALGTPSKSGQKLGRKAIRAYLKAAGYLLFKDRKKPFLTQKHKNARLRWAREHVWLGVGRLDASYMDR